MDYQLTELTNEHCIECGGLGFTVGVTSHREEYLCESCFLKFNLGDKVILNNDIVVEFNHGSETEGLAGEVGVVEDVDTRQWEIVDNEIVGIQYCVRLNRGNLVCVWDDDLRKQQEKCNAK